jgi:hypothetical protein
MQGTKKNIFLAMFEKRIGQKPGKTSSDGRARHRNRSGVVELFGREPLMFAKVENGLTKSCQFFRREKQEKRNFVFWAESFNFF